MTIRNNPVLGDVDVEADTAEECSAMIARLLAVMGRVGTNPASEGYPEDIPVKETGVDLTPAEQIVVRIDRLGLTQRFLASQVGWTKSKLNRVLKGNPTEDQVELLFGVLSKLEQRFQEEDSEEKT